MDQAVAYAISFIVVLGVGILIAGIGSSSPALWTCLAVGLISTDLVSAFGDC